MDAWNDEIRWRVFVGLAIAGNEKKPPEHRLNVVMMESAALLSGPNLEKVAKRWPGYTFVAAITDPDAGPLRIVDGDPENPPEVE
jgi:hypothetical protein